MLKSSDISKALLKLEEKDLYKIKPTPSERRVFDALEKTDLMKFGELTQWGKTLLNQYKTLAEKYGKSSIELVPTNAEGDGNYTYRVNVKPNAKEIVCSKHPKSPVKKVKSDTNHSECPQKKESIEEYAKKLKNSELIRNWELNNDCELNLETKISMHRTLAEINELKDFANELDVPFRRDNPSYRLGNVKITPGSTSSKNKRVPSEEEYLKITMIPGDPIDNEKSKKLVIRILQEFKPYKPL